MFTAISERASYVMTVADGQASLLSGTTIGNDMLTPMSWSRDGARLAGVLGAPSGAPVGVAAYDLSTKTVTKVTDDPTYGVLWLGDNRRVIYFTKGGWQLVVADTVTKTRTVVPVRLPVAAHHDVFAISADRRHIYYGGARAEADIWILERK